MIEEDRARRARDRRVEIRIFENDVRRLAAELERYLLEIPSCSMHDQFAYFGRTGKGDLVDIGMCCQSRSGSFAVARNNIDDSVWEARFRDQFAETQSREWRLLSWLKDYRASRCECGAEFPGCHQEREIPRNNLSNNADWLTQGIGEILRTRRVRNRDWNRVAFDFGSPSCHV